MFKSTSRIIMALSLSVLALAPLTASAQVYTGTNGKLVYLDSTGNLLSSNPDGQGTIMLATAAALGGQPGSMVAVNKAQTKIVYINNAATGLEIANIDGSGQIALTTTAADQNPVFSPDGNKIYFDNGQDIVSVNADGTGRTTLVTHTGTVNYFGPAVSPDGTKLAFAQNSSSTSISDIDTSTITGTSVTNLTNYTGTTNGTFPDFSPDGNIVSYVQSTATSSDVVTKPVAGGTPFVVATTPQSACAGNYYFGISYSPDGSKLAFSSHPATCSGGSGYVVATPNTANVDGTGFTTLTALGQVSHAYWSGLVLAAETTPAATPTLPAAGRLHASIPVALAIFGLLAAAGIETARRVRRQA